MAYVDGNGNIIVGSKVKRAMNSSKEIFQNDMAEIKCLMEAFETIYFSILNRSLLFEEISAKYLELEAYRKD